MGLSKFTVHLSAGETALPRVSEWPYSPVVRGVGNGARPLGSIPPSLLAGLLNSSGRQFACLQSGGDNISLCGLNGDDAHARYRGTRLAVNYYASQLAKVHQEIMSHFRGVFKAPTPACTSVLGNLRKSLHHLWTHVFSSRQCPHPSSK